MPIDEPFAKYCYKKDSHDYSTWPSQIWHTPFSLHSCHWHKRCWCTNSKCSSMLSFIQYPTIPKKVCKLSSLHFLQETTWPVGGLLSHPKPTLIFSLTPINYYNSPSQPFGNDCVSTFHCTPWSKSLPFIPQGIYSTSQEQCRCPYHPLLLWCTLQNTLEKSGCVLELKSKSILSFWEPLQEQPQCEV